MIRIIHQNRDYLHSLPPLHDVPTVVTGCKTRGIQRRPSRMDAEKLSVDSPSRSFFAKMESEDGDKTDAGANKENKDGRG